MLKDQRESSPVAEPCEAPAVPEAAAPAESPATSPAMLKGCTVPGCSGRFLARGYCVRHYYQVKRHGVVQTSGQRFARASRPRPDGGFPGVRPGRHLPAQFREAHCGEDACGEGIFARGLCRLHYIMARSQDLLA